MTPDEIKALIARMLDYEHQDANGMRREAADALTVLLADRETLKAEGEQWSSAFASAYHLAKKMREDNQHTGALAEEVVQLNAEVERLRAQVIPTSGPEFDAAVERAMDNLFGAYDEKTNYQHPRSRPYAWRRGKLAMGLRAALGGRDDA